MYKKHYTPLSKKERYMIEKMRREGKSIRFIARRLDRCPSTISREIQRNRGKRGYRHLQAHQKSQARQLERSYYEVLTERMKEEVRSLLEIQWSPEQIVERWRLIGKPAPSKNTLYRWIAKDRKAGGDLHTLLRNKGRHHGHDHRRKAYKQCIPGRVGIEKRPAIVEQRTRLGDWEADTMHGANHKGFLVTIVDRASRFTLMAQVQHKDKVSIEKAISSMLQPIADWVHTITFDNGREFSDHQKIAEKLNCDTYFATPYRSWERGTNESINKLIREYLPKGMSLRNLPKEMIIKIMTRLNNRPRKCLGFKTPAEVFQQLSGINYNLETSVAF